ERYNIKWALPPFNIWRFGELRTRSPFIIDSPSALIIYYPPLEDWLELKDAANNVSNTNGLGRNGRLA
ncbi:MAG: hypothetical protein QXP27_08640, partial [Candidatus Methanomethyliaceae archaeon]